MRPAHALISFPWHVQDKARKRPKFHEFSGPVGQDKLWKERSEKTEEIDENNTGNKEGKKPKSQIHKFYYLCSRYFQKNLEL